MDMLGLETRHEGQMLIEQSSMGKAGSVEKLSVGDFVDCHM